MSLLQLGGFLLCAAKHLPNFWPSVKNVTVSTYNEESQVSIYKKALRGIRYEVACQSVFTVFCWEASGLRVEKVSQRKLKLVLVLLHQQKLKILTPSDGVKGPALCNVCFGSV